MRYPGPPPWIHRPLEAVRGRLAVGLRADDQVPIAALLLTPPLPALQNFDHLFPARNSVFVANRGGQVVGPKAGPSPKRGRIFQRLFCRPEHRGPRVLVRMHLKLDFRLNEFHGRPWGNLYQQPDLAQLK